MIRNFNFLLLKYIKTIIILIKITFYFNKFLIRNWVKPCLEGRPKETLNISICEAKVELGGRIDKRSMKYHPSTLQGEEDYQTVSKLNLANREMDKRFNEDKYMRMWA